MAKKTGKKTVQIQAMVEQGDLEPKPIEENHIKIAKAKEELSQPALLVSRVNYPVTIKYDKSIIRVSPRARLKIADLSKVKGELPNEILVKKI